MNVSKIYTYLDSSKCYAMKKAEELADQKHAEEAKKLFEKSIQRAREIADAKNDPQHLINFLV